MLQVPSEGDWIEVLFDLKGQQGERAPVEVYHPEGIEDVEPTTIVDLFNVSGTLQSTEETFPQKTTSSLGWHDRFEDEGVRQVFLHLQQHGEMKTQLEIS